MGGLKPEISEEIQMVRPRMLKEAISLARMRDEQLSRQKKISRPAFINRPSFTQPANNKAIPTVPVKKLSWDEMQHRRA